MIRTLITLLALTGSAGAAGTAAIHVFTPSGSTVPIGVSITVPMSAAGPVTLGLRGDLLAFPGSHAPPALSALVTAEYRTSSLLTPYLGVGIGSATQWTGDTWTLHPTWTGLAGLRATLNSGFGLSLETRASRAAIGVAAGLTYEFPLGRTP